MSRRLLVVAFCFAGLGAALPAAAAGPPQGISEDGAGITSPDGTLRYIAVDAGPNTLLEAIHVRDGTLMNSVLLKASRRSPGRPTASPRTERRSSSRPTRGSAAGPRS